MSLRNRRAAATWLRRHGAPDVRVAVVAAASLVGEGYPDDVRIAAGLVPQFP